MKVSDLFRYTLPILAVLMACGEDPPAVIGECNDEACFNMSELESETDHYLPFILYNDVDEDYDKVLLNGSQVDLDYGGSLEFDKAGFYELVLMKDNLLNSAETLFFTLGTPEREHAEWGIEAWVPVSFQPTPLGSDEIVALYPRRYVEGMELPFIFYVYSNGQRVVGYGQGYCETSDTDFSIKYGEGSVLLSGESLYGTHNFTIDDTQLQLGVDQYTATITELSGAIEEDLLITENSAVHITGDLYISSGLSMTVEDGAIILIDEAVNIYTEGPITLQGTADNPIVVTSAQAGKYWGGFFAEVVTADIKGSYAIFCRSGYDDTGGSSTWGHAKRQALFRTSGNTIELDHCYMTDHIGQIFYPINTVLILESILVQRVKTAGQLNYSQATITNSIFTDFPEYSQVYIDDDNDGIYINASDVTIDNCIFMYAKDDGMDSGANEGGTITVTNTLFEGCFHEGAALSSTSPAVKTHLFRNCMFYNCGQGLELGFSSPNHTVTIEDCRFYNNYIGIRYGDNYSWSSVNGEIFVKNSESLHNGKDIWNMVRSLWAPRLDKMHFENVQVSSPSSQYPDLEVVE